MNCTITKRYWANCFINWFRQSQRANPDGPGIQNESLMRIWFMLHFTRLARGRMIKVERKVVFGSEQQVLTRLEASPSQTINTAYIERSNLDWRLWDAHLARKAPTVARSLHWLKAKPSSPSAHSGFP
jgi:hypothetical protein